MSQSAPVDDLRGSQLEPNMRGLRKFCQLVYGKKAPFVPAAARLYIPGEG